MTGILAQELRHYIPVGQENSTPVELYYEDHGSGKPVVLIHGWPLSGASWEKQTAALLAAGFRVITYDRRGFGKSTQPSTGYDYDTFAEDLHKLLTALALRDVALVGFSMGSGEVARYIGRHGTDRISKAVFLAGVPPYLLKTSDNQSGVDRSVFDGIKQAIAADRPAFLAQFLNNFYNVDELGGKLISDEVVRLSWNVAVGASAKGTLDCVTAWCTDFRKDLAKVDVPALVIHGTADRILPIEATGRRTQALVKGSRLAVIDGGPHGLTWTHAQQVNAELLSFLK
ncbi:MAG TPA: alpha/beta hydrolase [Gemmatimonadales bacterium]|nr:alpha/beta hydrolase [Gemmatimonadales bacterium]